MIGCGCSVVVILLSLLVFLLQMLPFSRYFALCGCYIRDDASSDVFQVLSQWYIYDETCREAQVQEAKSRSGIPPGVTLTPWHVAKVAEELVRLLGGRVPASISGPTRLDMPAHDKRKRKRNNREHMPPFHEMRAMRYKVEYNQMVRRTHLFPKDAFSR